MGRRGRGDPIFFLAASAHGSLGHCRCQGRCWRPARGLAAPRHGRRGRRLNPQVARAAGGRKRSPHHRGGRSSEVCSSARRRHGGRCELHLRGVRRSLCDEADVEDAPVAAPAPAGAGRARIPLGAARGSAHQRQRGGMALRGGGGGRRGGRLRGPAARLGCGLGRGRAVRGLGGGQRLRGPGGCAVPGLLDRCGLQQAGEARRPAAARTRPRCHSGLGLGALPRLRRALRAGRDRGPRGRVPRGRRGRAQRLVLQRSAAGRAGGGGRLPAPGALGEPAGSGALAGGQRPLLGRLRTPRFCWNPLCQRGLPAGAGGVPGWRFW
mmetsp:Transcript_12931/g.36880  ORF Transcript_12931/g.36880 Transcript_12931/m.36880 type:complete len:323 (-) Transcript_12931:122-1090(-)